ncbi:hypothetical protein Prum_001010 [Phytohabitans rumicis]|uniref:EthD domain-containing protein n=1 Tax=Phytohabitans rumicis TaxID=1076125 RepID=A0A6V8KVX7_9ACTN|nr:hypothetical protein Prum_001010 [Phytohabitans rumicis]
MYNLVVLASRPPEWSHEQFIAWWRGEHAGVTLALPGLRRWRHMAVDRALEPRSEGWDGLSVLSFDTAEDLDLALASPEWKAAIAHVGPMRGRRIAVMGPEAELFTA